MNLEEDLNITNEYYLEKNKNSRGPYQLLRYVHNHVLTLGNR